MKQVLFLAVTLVATLATLTTANASYTDKQNKKRWAVQEDMKWSREITLPEQA